MSNAQKAQSFQNCTRGALWALWNSSLLQNVKKMKRPLETLKIFQKNSKNGFLNSVTVSKKCKRGDPLGFLTSILLQIIETIEGGGDFLV